MLWDFFKLCFFVNARVDHTVKMAFMRKVCLYYLVFGAFYYANINQDALEAFILMIMRLLIIAAILGLFLFFIKKTEYFRLAFTAIMVSEDFFVTIAILNEAINFIARITNEKLDLSYWGWINISWRFLLFIFIYRKTLSVSWWIALFMGIVTYAFLSGGTALLVEVLF